MNTPSVGSALTASPAAQWRWAGMLLPAAIVAVGYYVGCLAGFGLRFPSSGISFFWPPTALLTAALLLAPKQIWPALLAAAFAAHALAHAQNGVAPAVWPIQFLGNATQAVLAAVIVRWRTTAPSLFGDLRTAVTFVFGVCLIAPAVASLIPAYAYVQLGWATDFSQAWRSRTVSNAVASLTLVPSIVLAWRFLWARPRAVPRRLGEYALLLLGVFGAHAAAGYVERTDVLGLLVVLYAPVPFLIWSTMRFGGAGLSLALLWTTLLTLSSALMSHGPLATSAGADTVVAIQLFLVMTAVPMMLIAGLVEQSRAKHLALVEAERQNSAILQAQPDLMFVQTRAGVYLKYYAKHPSQMLVAPDRFLGKNMHDVLPWDMAAQFAIAFQTVTTEQSVLIEYTLVFNGATRRYEARVIALDDDRVLSIVREITDRWKYERELHDAQERYALATAAGGIAVWDFNAQTGNIRVQGALHATLGYTEDEIGPQLSDWERLVIPADRDDVRARLMSYTVGAGPTLEAEFRMIHKDGSVRWFLTTGAVAERIGAAPSRVIGTIADVTERKASALALNEANDALIRMGRIGALAELSASIAHELHQPLTAIAANALACLERIDAAAPFTDARDALTDVVNEAQRASHIVARTHEMFTNRPMQKSVVNLNAAIRNVLEISGGRLRERGVALELRLHEELPAVLGDTVQIQQVLLNLVGNAVEAMDGITDRPRVLRIGSRRYRNGAVVSVRDTGRGLDQHTVRRVFEPFYTTKVAGVGMGLTASRSIINSHGGSLWAVTNRGEGATFRFKIPVPHESNSDPVLARYAKKVLIVDDHEEMRSSIRRLVRAWGHDVAVAADGPGAITVAHTFQPDCAILDISLPGMTGIDLARHLLDVMPRRPFLIALTAFREPETRAACLAAGFDAYLTKTGDLAQLEQLLVSPARVTSVPPPAGTV
jgi:PAS domain S-box-containing protein